MRTKLIAIVVVQLWLGTTRPLWAQTYLHPYLGFNWGGDSGCASAQNGEDKTLNIGASFGRAHGRRAKRQPAEILARDRWRDSQFLIIETAHQAIERSLAQRAKPAGWEIRNGSDTNRKAQRRPA